MNDIQEEEPEMCEYEYQIAFLERTLQIIMVGMDALEESRDRLRAENAHLKSIIEIHSKKVH